MIPYGGKELANGFRTVRKNTIQVAKDIPEAQYQFVAAPEVKSAAAMLTHVAVVPGFWDEIHRKQRLTTMAGFDSAPLLERVQTDEAKQRSNAEKIQPLRAPDSRRFLFARRSRST